MAYRQIIGMKSAILSPLLHKPIFMLAEGEHTYLRNDSSFVVGYAWRIHHLMNDIAQGKKTVNELDTLLEKDRKDYTYGYNMYFTSNHDENSWAGTEFERMGDGVKAFAALSATLDGMPLLYSGQEEPLKKRLAFFEKDTIPFKNYEYASFYQTLNELKHKNKALWNGDNGGLSTRVNTSDHVYAFMREHEGDKLIGVFNLSDKPQTTKLTFPIEDLHIVFSDKKLNLSVGQDINLQPWEFFLSPINNDESAPVGFGCCFGSWVNQGEELYKKRIERYMPFEYKCIQTSKSKIPEQVLSPKLNG